MWILRPWKCFLIYVVVNVLSPETRYPPLGSDGLGGYPMRPLKTELPDRITVREAWRLAGDIAT